MSDEIKSLLRDVLREELTSFEKTLTSMEQDLIELKCETVKWYEKLGSDIENVHSRIEAIEKNYDEMKQCLDKIEHDQARKDRKISSIIVQYQHLESFISKEIKRLQSINSNQKTIELLSSRSIQHEADIKELNRVVNDTPQHFS
ncbi:hypothetical protein [Bacillus sp. T3]|uniref:hypothetical protein n=1 Tax=Bacillus sp. T3 TaxID=467262 RepID=UPI00298156A7|nr:hypothetical protein [Bacillus sp. T3]